MWVGMDVWWLWVDGCELCREDLQKCEGWRDVQMMKTVDYQRSDYLCFVTLLYIRQMQSYHMYASFRFFVAKILWVI
jgi:hypothetical protein